MKRIECIEPEDIQNWYSETEPRLTSQKKLFQKLSKEFSQMKSTCEQLLPRVEKTTSILNELYLASTDGFLPDMVKNANNKFKAFKGILLDIIDTFSHSIDSLKKTEKNTFPLISNIKKNLPDNSKLKPIDSCAICSAFAYQFLETTLIDICSICVDISIDLQRFTTTQKYSMNELKTIKEITIPQLRSDMKTSVNQFKKSIAGKTIKQLISEDNLTEYELPLHLHKMMYFLYTTGYETTGVFRLSERADTVALYAKYPGMIDYSPKNTILISAALKKIMRDLPEPVVSSELFDEIIKLTSEYEQNRYKEEENPKAMKFEMKNNPYLNPMKSETSPLYIFLSKIKVLFSNNTIVCTVFKYFMELCVKITSGPSLMTSNNLAICLGPCLLVDRKSSLENMTSITSFMQILIDNYSYVFSDKTVYTKLPKSKTVDYKILRTTLISGKEAKDFMMMAEEDQKKQMKQSIEMDLMSPAKVINEQDKQKRLSKEQSNEITSQLNLEDGNESLMRKSLKQNELKMLTKKSELTKSSYLQTIQNLEMNNIIIYNNNNLKRTNTVELNHSTIVNKYNPLEKQKTQELKESKTTPLSSSKTSNKFNPFENMDQLSDSSMIKMKGLLNGSSPKVINTFTNTIDMVVVQEKMKKDGLKSSPRHNSPQMKKTNSQNQVKQVKVAGVEMNESQMKHLEELEDDFVVLTELEKKSPRSVSPKSKKEKEKTEQKIITPYSSDLMSKSAMKKKAATQGINVPQLNKTTSSSVMSSSVKSPKIKMSKASQKEWKNVVNELKSKSPTIERLFSFFLFSSSFLLRQFEMKI